jgi:hypothetical protein
MSISTLRREVLARFPEFGPAPNTWTWIDTALSLSTLFYSALGNEDVAVSKRVLLFLLWAEEQTAEDEEYVYFLQDVMRKSLGTRPTRDSLASLLSGRTFAQLRGVIEFLTSRAITDEMASTVGASRK